MVNSAFLANGRREFAVVAPRTDITRPYIDPLGRLLLPTDDVLMLEGARGWRRLQLYEKVKQNAQVFSCLQQRFSALVQSPVEVIPGPRPGLDPTEEDYRAVDFIRDQLASHVAWDSVTYQMIWAVLYGYSVAELLLATDGRRIVLDGDRGGIKVRDRKRFVFDARGGTRLLTQSDSYYGEALPEGKFWVVKTGADHSDEPYGLGLGHYLYWLDWFQRNDLKFWLFFLEKWAQPTPRGTYGAGATEQDKDTLLEAMSAIMTDAGVAIPDTMDIQLLEAQRSGTADYESVYEQMDKAISKVCLSQTMTTDDGSSLAQAKVHAGVAEHLVRADAQLVNGSFNSGPVRWLIEANRPWLGDAMVPVVSRRVGAEDRASRVEIDRTLFDMGYQLLPEKQAEVYGAGYAYPNHESVHDVISADVAQAVSSVMEKVSAGALPSTNAVALLEAMGLTREKAQALIPRQPIDLSDRLPNPEFKKRETVPPDEVPALYQEKTAEQLDPVLDRWIAQISELLSVSPDYATFSNALATLYPDLDMESFGEGLTDGLSAAYLAGLNDVEEESL